MYPGIPVIFVLAVSCASFGTDYRDLPFSTNRMYVANVSPPGVTMIDFEYSGEENPAAYPVYFSGNRKKRQSRSIGVSKDGKYLWFSEGASAKGGYVRVVDARTSRVLKTWNVGAGAGSHISRDGRWGFFASEKTANPNINVFDIQNQRYLGYIELGGSPHSFDTSADGALLYTTKYPTNILYEYDISGLAVVAAETSGDRLGVKLPITPRRAYKHSARDCHGAKVICNTLMVHPNGRFLILGSYIADSDGNPIGSQAYDSFIDISKGIIYEFARIRGGSYSYEISPDGNYLISAEWETQKYDDETHHRNYVVFWDGEVTTPLLRCIDISTLDTASPDPGALKVVEYLDSADLGYGGAVSISNAMYAPSGEHLFVTTVQPEDNDKKELIILDGKVWKTIKRIRLPGSSHGLAAQVYGG
jgi:hypothetical protein